MKTQLKGIAVAGALLFSMKGYSYDVINRFRLIDDKLKTEQMLRPYGHDFLLDVGATLNKNLQDFVDDIDKASKSNDLTTASNTIAKYDKTEQTINLKFALGIPLPSFNPWEVHIRPNLRAMVDAGANIAIRSQILTTADVLSFFGNDIPADFRAFVLGLSPGDDVIDKCKIEPTLSAQTRAYCATQPSGKYIVPNASQQVPTVSFYAKGDAKVGFFNDYTYGEHFFGNFNLYGMTRLDGFQLVTAQMIAKGEKIEAPKANNETTVQADYRLGYLNANYRVFASIEELKLSTLSKTKESAKPLQYGYDPLMRLHAYAIYRLSAFSLSPFVGVHKRTGYGFSEGLYGGTDLGAHVWGDRIGLLFRGMVDKEYFTFSPRMKLWIMQLEYSLKAPLKSMDGDVKLSALHSFDLRFFF